MLRKISFAIILMLIFASLGIIIYLQLEKRKPIVSRASLPEQLVFVRSDDSIVNGGVVFSPKKNNAKATAIIWIHGWGVNFYSPTYITIGRAIAARGFTCIVGNTRITTWALLKLINGASVSEAEVTGV